MRTCSTLISPNECKPEGGSKNGAVFLPPRLHHAPTQSRHGQDRKQLCTKGLEAPGGQVRRGQSMSSLFPCASNDFCCVST